MRRCWWYRGTRRGLELSLRTVLVIFLVAGCNGQSSAVPSSPPSLSPTAAGNGSRTGTVSIAQPPQSASSVTAAAPQGNTTLAKAIAPIQGLAPKVNPYMANPALAPVFSAPEQSQVLVVDLRFRSVGANLFPLTHTVKSVHSYIVSSTLAAEFGAEGLTIAIIDTRNASGQPSVDSINRLWIRPSANFLAKLLTYDLGKKYKNEMADRGYTNLTVKGQGYSVVATIPVGAMPPLDALQPYGLIGAGYSCRLAVLLTGPGSVPFTPQRQLALLSALGMLFQPMGVSEAEIQSYAENGSFAKVPNLDAGSPKSPGSRRRLQEVADLHRSYLGQRAGGRGASVRARVALEGAPAGPAAAPASRLAVQDENVTNYVQVDVQVQIAIGALIEAQGGTFAAYNDKLAKLMALLDYNVTMGFQQVSDYSEACPRVGQLSSFRPPVRLGERNSSANATVEAAAARGGDSSRPLILTAVLVGSALAIVGIVVALWVVKKRLHRNHKPMDWTPIQVPNGDSPNGGANFHANGGGRASQSLESARRGPLVGPHNPAAAKLKQAGSTSSRSGGSASSSKGGSPAVSPIAGSHQFGRRGGGGGAGGLPDELFALPEIGPMGEMDSARVETLSVTSDDLTDAPPSMAVSKIIESTTRMAQDNLRKLASAWNYAAQHLHAGAILKLRSEYVMTGRRYQDQYSILCSARLRTPWGAADPAVRDPHSRIVLVKVYADVVAFSRESQVFEHPNISTVMAGLLEVSLPDTGRSLESAGPACLVTAMPASSLHEWLVRGEEDPHFDEDQVATVFDVARAVRVLHTHNAVHLTLTPSSFGWFPDLQQWLLVSAPRWLPPGTITHRPQCHLRYTAPETIGIEASISGKGLEVSPSVDIWSVGVMAYEVFSGKRLFGEDQYTDGEVVGMLLGTVPLPWEADSNFFAKNLANPEARPVLGAMLRRSPGDRITIHNVLESKLFQRIMQLDVVESSEAPSSFFSPTPRTRFSPDFRMTMTGSAFDSGSVNQD